MTESGSPSAVARVGARWWADKIRNGFFPDNGAQPDDATKSPMALGLIATLQAKEAEAITPEKVDAFEVALAQRLQAMLDSWRTWNTIGVDYHPDPQLAAALVEAGIKPGMTVLPWKTIMWIEPGRVRVGDGYRAEPVELPLGDLPDSSSSGTRP